MPILGGCRRRLRSVGEALETTASPTLKRLRRENEGLLARVGRLEAKMEADAEARVLLEQRVLQLTTKEQEDGQDQQDVFREEVRQLRDKVARAEAARIVSHAATAERSKLQSDIDKDRSRMEALEMETLQLQQEIDDHRAERQALQTDKKRIEDERQVVEKKLAEKNRRSMISRAHLEKKLQAEREENAQLHQQISDALHNNEALLEGTHRWEEWAAAQQHTSGAPSTIAAPQAHLGAQA